MLTRMDAPQLSRLYEDDVCTMYSWRSLIVISWRKQPSAKTVTALAPQLVHAAKSVDGGVVVCARAGAGVALPGPEARELLQRGIERIGPHTNAVVNVLAGTGFVAAAQRAFLSGLALFVRPSYPLAFVGSDVEASAFIARHWSKTDGQIPNGESLVTLLNGAA